MKRSRKKRKSLAEELLAEVYYISEMLKQEGKSGTECRYYEITAELLILILNSLSILRTFISFLTGFALSLLIKLFLSGS